jgi:hypothetical protein
MCKRSYLCLASLDAWITNGRSFFSLFPKLPNAQFWLNVVCLHVDVFFLPSSLLPSLVWSKSCKGAGQEECERVWGWRLPLPSELPFWELESRWTSEPSKSNCRGQNTSHWRVLYIIEKLLKWKCLKWARITHLDICNTSYGKKKGRESNWQFDSQLRNLGNRPDFRACRWCATHRWEAFDKCYNFALNLVPIGGLSTKL